MQTPHELVNSKFKQLVNSYGPRVILYNLGVQLILLIAFEIIYATGSKKQCNNFRSNHEDTSQQIIAVHVIYSILSFLAYVGAQIYYSYHSEVWIIVLNVINLLNLFCYYLLTPHIYKKFTWQKFKQIGASVEVREQNTVYESFKSSLKIYVFLSVIFFLTIFFYGDVKTFQANTEVSVYNITANTLPLVLDSLLVVIFLIWCTFGYQGARRENSLWLKSWLVFAVIFQIFRLVRIFNILPVGAIFQIYNEKEITAGYLFAVYNLRAAIFNVACGLMIHYGLKRIKDFGGELSQVLRRSKEVNIA